MPYVRLPILVLLGFLAGSALLSIVLVRIGITLALRIGFVRKFNPILQDRRTIALGGGVAFGIVIVASSFLLWQLGCLSIRIPVVLILVMILGVFDDVKKLSPLTKLAGLIVVTTAYLMQTGITPSMFPLAVLFMVSAQNAWNLVDVMDGLAGWISMVCFAGITVIILLSSPGLSGIALCGLTTTGAVLGFLVWNSPPARVFMGDAGSLTLGTVFGVLVIEVFSTDPLLAGALAVTGLIPLFETGFLIIERSLKHVPIYRGSPDHFAVRLRSRGHSVSAILRIVTAIGIGLSVLSWVIVQIRSQPLLVGCVLAIISLLAVWSFRFLHALPSKGDASES